MRESALPLTTQQVATFCGVSTQTVIDWLNKGRLHAQGSDTEPRVTASDLIHFMDENCLAIPPDLLNPQHAAPTVTPPPATEPVFSPTALITGNDADSSYTITSVLNELNITPLQEPGETVFEAVMQKHPQLITLEIGDGDTDTLAMIERLRQSDMGDIKILVASNQMPSVLVKAKSAGADAVVTKPIDRTTLKRTIKILLNLNTTA